MININQITIQIKVLLNSHLNSSISRLLSQRAWWKGELCKEGVGREINHGDGFCEEFLFFVDEDFLNFWVRGLGPEGGKGCHFAGFV